MADTETTMEALQAELDSLRSQLQDMANKAKGKEHELVDRIGQEFGRYRSIAREHGGHLVDMGEAGLDEVAAQIRRNPLASLGIAFGAGWVLSCIWRHLR